MGSPIPEISSIASQTFFFSFNHTRIQPYVDYGSALVTIFPVCRPAPVREAPKSWLGGSALAPFHR